MAKSTASQDYRFLIPKIHISPLSDSGQTARSIRYRLEEGITPQQIRRELADQPHMKALAQALDPQRKIYLLCGFNNELLELAAEYIGTFHRLSSTAAWEGEDDLDDGDPDDELDPSCQEEPLSFDFDGAMPYLEGYEVLRAYSPSDDFFTGPGNFGFMPQARGNRCPWWMWSQTSPLAVRANSGWGPNLVRAIQSAAEQRALVIVLWQTGATEDSPAEQEEGFNAEDLSFELETPVLHLETPGADSAYKKRVLRQLVRERGARLGGGETAGAVLHLVESSRGDTDNRTLSKAVANALLRRRHGGPLTRADFTYLSQFSAVAKTQVPQERALIGQEEVKRQLRQVVDALAFQKKRRDLGLKSDPIQCTFAFLGAPGTGKTTWALRLGRELARLRLLENTQSICINAAELKAKYVGHTTGRVKALFDQYGIIILDEAYSLTEEDQGDSFTQEALAQLCVELEKHAGDRLVVFAGYGGDGDPRGDRMLRFLRCNPGISSRVAFKIHFTDFQPSELVRVFRSMLAEGGYQVPDQCDAQVENLFRRIQNRPDFGNCREARNLADRVKVQMSWRLAAEDKLTVCQASQVLPEDVAAAVEELTAEERLVHRSGRSVGF